MKITNISKFQNLAKELKEIPFTRPGLERVELYLRGFERVCGRFNIPEVYAHIEINVDKSRRPKTTKKDVTYNFKGKSYLSHLHSPATVTTGGQYGEVTILFYCRGKKIIVRTISLCFENPSSGFKPDIYSFEEEVTTTLQTIEKLL